MDQIKVGQYLADLRLNQALTIEQAAEQLSVTSEEITKWEKGDELGIETLIKLAKFYKVSIDCIINTEPPKPVNENGNFLQRFSNNTLFQFAKVIACFFILFSYFMPYNDQGTTVWGVRISSIISGFSALTNGAIMVTIGAWLLCLGTIALTLYSVLKLLQSLNKNHLIEKIPAKTLNIIIPSVLGGCVLGEVLILLNGIYIGMVFSLLFLVGFGLIYLFELKNNKANA